MSQAEWEEQIFGHVRRCKKTKKGGGLARDKPIFRRSIPCRAAKVSAIDLSDAGVAAKLMRGFGCASGRAVGRGKSFEVKSPRGQRPSVLAQPTAFGVESAQRAKP